MNEKTCPHKNTVLGAEGGWHFDGEPWDDIRIYVFCLDCLEEVLETSQESGNEIDDIPF